MFCYTCICIFYCKYFTQHVISKMYPLGRYRSYEKVSRVYLGNPVDIFIHRTPIEYTMHRRSLVTRFESLCIAREKRVPRKGFLGRDVTETSISNFTSVSNRTRNVLSRFSRMLGDLGYMIRVSLLTYAGV